MNVDPQKNEAPEEEAGAFVCLQGVCFCFFTKTILKLTIDIFMRKIILEVEHFIKSMIYQMLKSNKSRFDSKSVREQCIDHIPYYLSGLSRALF